MSHWHLTTGELAFAVPAGVIVGALISLAGQRLTNKANLDRVRAERLWDKRFDLYVGLLRTSDGLIDGLEDWGREYMRHDPADYISVLYHAIEEVNGFGAEFIAISSDRVNAARLS